MENKKAKRAFYYRDHWVVQLAGDAFWAVYIEPTDAMSLIEGTRDQCLEAIDDVMDEFDDEPAQESEVGHA